MTSPRLSLRFLQSRLERNLLTGEGSPSSLAYQNLYQGKTTKRAAQNLDKLGLIGDKSKVRFDKAGQTAQLNPGALLGADVFRRSQFEWVKNVLLPQLAKKGITDNKQITDIIGSIVSNRTGANLLSTMVNQRKIIERDSNLAKNAGGIDATGKGARGTLAGQQIAFKAGLENLKLNLGDVILPAFTRFLTQVNTGLEKLNAFVKAHPKLARSMVVGFVAITAALVAAVPLLVTASAALNAYGMAALLAARRNVFLATTELSEATASKVATVGFLARTRAMTSGMLKVNSLKSGLLNVGLALTSLPKAFSVGLFSRLKSLAGGLLRIVTFRSSFLMLGRAVAMLLTPVSLLGAAFVVAGVLIYKYWRPIQTFFVGFAKGFKTALAPIMPVLARLGAAIASSAARVWKWFTKLLTPVHQTKTGLESTAKAGEKFGAVVGGAITWVIDKLRTLFHLLGSVYDRLAKLGKPLAHLWGDTKAGVTGFANEISHWVSSPGVALAGTGAMGGASTSNRATHQQNHFNITQQPGQSPRELAHHIATLITPPSSRKSLSDGAD